ncbi:MAG: SDR family oxidoreductase [Brevundimonas sp.]
MSARVRLKPLSEQVILVTGATSGIGLSTARRAAAAGACVFALARGEGDLKSLCEEIQRAGGRAAYAVADVADLDALKAAADKCERLFGRIDTWVNNAGVSIFGGIRDTALSDQRRLFETNYWGVVNGCLVAAERLRERGGAIINVGSTLADAPIPVQGVYSASKHAVKGFTNAFRMEIIRDKAPIVVTLVKPAAIDTPYNKHAKNLTGYAAHNPQPVYATHVVADAILHCAAHPIREITVGGGGRLIAAFYSALPGLAEPLFAAFAPVLMLDRKADPYAGDGLYDPTEDGLEEEVRYPMVRQFSVLAEARKHPGATVGGLAALVALGALAVLLSQRQGPTRYERWKAGLDPRGWASAWRRGFDTALEELQDGAHEARHQAQRIGRRAGRKGRRFARAAEARLPRDEVEVGLHAVRSGAGRAGRYARDHAREGGAVLALATIAAAVAAAALDSRNPEGRVRRVLRS